MSPPPLLTSLLHCPVPSLYPFLPHRLIATQTHVSLPTSLLCPPQVRKEVGPFLIAAPSSVLPNWLSELRTWAPGLVVVEYRGSPETREEIFNRKVRQELQLWDQL